jgi:hypothetical protein
MPFTPATRPLISGWSPIQNKDRFVERHRTPPLRHIRIFEPEDVISLLRFEIKQAGSHVGKKSWP